MDLYYVYLDEENLKFRISTQKQKSKIVITILVDDGGAMELCEDLDNFISTFIKDPKKINQMSKKIEYTMRTYLDVHDFQKRRRLFFYLKNLLYISKLTKVKKILK